ncbi:MAG: tRNA (N6-isopentenyl adenosine(37)-C2)-methylthiotransferase MiaB, partial [Clostridia bacterium]|nr:tRNA (N6-isopentenyl adenosine(37)-C2)-methylthiotransferase MiaB [Clostridia bacterium]
MKKDRFVPKEELLRQEEISNSLSSYWKEQGKTPLAMVITYGCQQNENDSERIRGMLSQMGYGFTED